jgi:hypothetical protein
LQSVLTPPQTILDVLQGRDQHGGELLRQSGEGGGQQLPMDEDWTRRPALIIRPANSVTLYSHYQG